MGSRSRKHSAAADDGGEPSVTLQMPEVPNGGGGSGRGGGGHRNLIDRWGSTMFEPQPEISDPARGESSSFRSFGSTGEHAPEKKLTLFALRLAILEKAASGLGALGFIWATVVLFGGFVNTLDKTDFWVVTVILLIESSRIFSRSHELEWQHQSTWSLAKVGRHSFRAFRSSPRRLTRAVKSFLRSLSIDDPADRSKVAASAGGGGAATETRRTWESSDVPLLPYAGWVFLSRNISRALYWLQLLSATACVALSLMGLIQQDYGEIAKGDTDKRNRKAAINVFYATALAEAAMFLGEKVYWEYKVAGCKLLEVVNRECGFDQSGVVSIRRFFYDAYSRCINGSIFDGLRMDLVSFATELLDSDSYDEQLMGAQILQKFATSDQFADGTLRKIGTSTAVIERLLEMLNWKKSMEQEIRRAAAEVVSKLAGKKQNALRVAGIPGAMESISSLLYTGRSTIGMPDEVCRWHVVADDVHYEYSAFNLLGLLILKKLAHDHDNCGKIGNTGGLLSKIIDFTGAGERLLHDDRMTESQIRAVKRSLQLVKMLASTTALTGQLLRREISEIVFTISNIQEILQYGENHMMLQKLGAEILTSLAMDKEARERIGRTGGVIRELVGIFFRPGMSQNENSVRVEAGEALAMLALDSRGSCERMLRQGGLVERLAGALQDPVTRVNAARILRNLCAYADDDCYLRLRDVAAAMPTVQTAIMAEEQKLLEVSIGLASQIFHFASQEEQAEGFQGAGVTEDKLAKRLVHTLRRYNRPRLNVPRMRRFAIELAIQMMRSNSEAVHRFRHYKLGAELKGVAETTSELECFNVFSGSVGIGRHHRSVFDLVDTAFGLLASSTVTGEKSSLSKRHSFYL